MGLGGLLRFFSYEPQADQVSEFQLGDVANFPAGSRIFHPEIPAVIYNAAGVIRAYGLTCTHLGCRLEASGPELKCPCHGSEFDRDGNVTRGPAKKPQETLEVEISQDGQLIVKVH